MKELTSSTSWAFLRLWSLAVLISLTLSSVSSSVGSVLTELTELPAIGAWAFPTMDTISLPVGGHNPVLERKQNLAKLSRRRKQGLLFGEVVWRFLGF
jgi:hypothetical protein